MFDATAEKEIAQLREKGYIPFTGSEFLNNRQLQFPSMSTRIIRACFDLQRHHGLSPEKTLAGMAIALAEALDNQEKFTLDNLVRQSPSPIMLCPECPRKEYVLSSIGKE
jgi:hypothetical protein